jgi:zinc transport system substrate-binding protein
MRRSLIIGMTTLLAVLASACGGADSAGSGRQVVAAFYPVAYAAEEVAPGAHVTNLTPAGAEPHDLELTPRDVERVRDADLVLYLGGGFMPALEDAVSGHENAVDLLAGLSLLRGSDEHGHDGEGSRSGEESEHADENALDPHVWLDPMRYAVMAERIATALGEPEAASGLRGKLEELDEDFRTGLATCKRRVMVTSHAAFAYLADAYDLEQITLTGVSPEVEPSAKAIEDLVHEVEEEGVTTVFFETLVSPRLAQTVARESGATTAVLNPLEGLTADESDAGADYFSVMRENLATLRTALECN